MSDPKFANLPGITYDQPDIYETGDDVSEDTSDFYEEENESIERLHISTKDSYNKFKGKYLTGNIDFSERIGRKSRTGYDARSTEWNLCGDGEKETPLQRFRRLQCEMDEFLQDLSNLQVDSKVSKEEKESYEAIGTVVNNTKKVLDSLRLEQVLGKETFDVADAEVKQLMSHVDEYRKSGGASALTGKLVNVGGGELVQTTRIATLEYRLHQLEISIGAKPEKLSRLSASLGTASLLDAVQQLSTRAALLQPSQLDLIEARLNNLATKMDTINEKANVSTHEVAREQKTLELYEIAKRTEPVTQILPEMIDRMQALEALHSYATNFSKIIAEQEAVQQNLGMNLTNNKGLLQGVQEAFAVNLLNVNGEVVKLEERIQNLNKAIVDT